MEPFVCHTGVVAALDRSNIDTDAIIPKQFLKSIRRTGFDAGLFYDWRFRPDGTPDPAFPLNHSAFSDASILLTRHNFGCGSSREHAPWALQDYGLTVVIAPSFADIFFNNCFKIGLLPIVLDAVIVDKLIKDTLSTSGYRLLVDLSAQTVTAPSGEVYPFEIDPFRKHCLLNGLDEIGLTLQHADKIKQYEENRRGEQPWLFM